MLAFADPDLDNGPRTDRSATMRMCAVMRQVRPIDELIRFVVSPQGEVVPDLKRKLPGRGLWVSASHQAVAEAVRRNQFSKGFKRDLRIAPTLAADTEGLLVRSVIDALSRHLARLGRERGLGPWSVGVVALEGLGRCDIGLVGDLGLIKLLRAIRGRPVEGWETAELLEPYGEWRGLASVYLLAAFGRGLLPLSGAHAA